MQVDTALKAGGFSHPGLLRGVNEDRYHFDSLRKILIVIDGMGGQAAGERAADAALAAIRARLERETGALADRVREAITLANNDIHRQAAQSPEWHGMACVLTVAVVGSGEVVIGHVGDTRLYKLRAGRIEKLTRDHSPVGEREDAGELNEREAMHHPRRNEVYRDVGSEPREPHDPNFIDVYRAPFEADAALLLCSDGLTDAIGASAIAEIVRALRRASGRDRARARRCGERSGGQGQRHRRVCRGSAVRDGRGDARPARASPRAGGPQGAGGASCGACLRTRSRDPTAEGPDAALGDAAGRCAARGCRRRCRLPPAGSPESRAARCVQLDSVGPERARHHIRSIGPHGEGGRVDRRRDRTGHARLAGRRRAGRVPGNRSGSRAACWWSAGFPRAASLRLPAGASEVDAAVVATDVTDAGLSGFRIVGDSATPLGGGVIVRDSDITLSDVEISGAHTAAIDYAGRATGSLFGADLHDNPGVGLMVRSGAMPRITHNTLSRNATGRGAAAALVVEASARRQWSRIRSSARGRSR